MTNTTKRIISAIILIILVALCIYMGKIAAMILILAVGSLIIDEVYCNFFQRVRTSVHYVLTQAVFILPYGYWSFICPSVSVTEIFVKISVVTNLVCFTYLFFFGLKSKLPKFVGDNFPYLVGILVLLPFMAILDIVFYEKWRFLLLILLVANFSTDIGAWFFGILLGKHKLWPAISPKKTLEGLYGGIFMAGLFGGLTWYFVFDTISVVLVLSFMLLGLMAQSGDLIQSKVKRQFGIKDSSSLIPGHGGVYDRVDSLVFIAPFFALVMRYYLNN